MPERYWVGIGLSAGFLVCAFFLSGFHEEIKWRIRRRRYGGWL